MIKYIAEMPSYTYAQKAVKVLNARGYSCEMIRREEGCGYNIRIYSRDKSVFEILEKYRIPYSLKGNGGVT
ncbi:MAG: DUF3343 domain-containing protein [Ruminococcus sp.]|nr:DUF3343 domain-containing protein [Ruminococcus sp.]MDE7225484.1 DUF3343 domain-containing protein [Ruminococcus sp.]